MRQKLMGIEAVFFDVGGVLIHAAEDAGMRRWEARLGLPRLGLWKRLYRAGIVHDADEGKVAEAEVYQMIGEWYELDDEAVTHLAAEFWDGWALDLELYAYFKGLRPHFRTGIISNAWSEARSKIGGAYDINETAEVLIFSAEVGLRKPDTAIYELALSEMGVTAAEAVFVDDRKENVAAAEALGMQGIQYQSTQQVIAELNALLGLG